MRPVLRFLSDELTDRIIAEAREVVCTIGLEIHNDSVVSMLADHGASIDKRPGRTCLTKEIIDKALGSVVSSFKLYDVTGRETHHFAGNNVHFTPGSAAMKFLAHASRESREVLTSDYIRYAKLVSRLEHLASQSTAMVPSDVNEQISDSYRLYLGLTHCVKPVVTGAFTVESFGVMKDMQLAVRGSQAALDAKPLTIFTCCPLAPLRWSDVTSQHVVECARHSIPVEFVSMPLAGFTAPVTLVGTLVQHTAECLVGVVISQLTNPGSPALWGGSTTIFDVRCGTTPMGAVESMMLACGTNEIGKRLGLPTQAYISLSDAKQLDAQAGLESSMGATLAALAGINNVSGPGMLDFENCFSLEKLVVDHEACGMVHRLTRGIEPCEDLPTAPLFEELLAKQHLLIADHSRRHLKQEQYFPGPAIDRTDAAQWQQKGSLTLGQRAHAEVERLISAYEPSPLDDGIKKELTRLMKAEAAHHGMSKLPYEA